jgi:hypothetical protein
VINQTYPLSEDGETQFSAVWSPTFSGSLDQMFVDESEYNYGTSSSSVISIMMSETTYYIMNVERPITDEDELIFTNLLFTIVCLEIFGIGFLIFKIMIIPTVSYVFGFLRRVTSKEKSSKNNSDSPDMLITRI